MLDVTTVSFTRMADGTQADYELLEESEQRYVEGLVERVLTAIRGLGDGIDGYKVSRLEHSIQSATRAYRDGRDNEYIVAALVHDVGDSLAPWSHSEMAAAILRPFVRPELHWIVKHHGLFQLYYYGHFVGEDRNARDRFEDHEYYDACIEFCDLYDQESFDPEYESLPLEFFEPMLRQVFAEPRYLPGHSATTVG
jgi:predicted HD phosphohydrolase